MSRKGGAARFLAALLITGVAAGLIAYPFVANYIFENRADSLVKSIEKTAQETGDEEQQAAIAMARQYNENLNSNHIKLTDPFYEEVLTEEVGDYESLLNMTDDGVMGSIEIPSIDVSLPIYHGTSDEVLDKGVGHMEGTSLPVGGESTHCVLTGHTGLSNAKLFTDLTEMEEGDIFFLHIFGETLAYEVDQIKVVLPTELDDLYITDGKDYCTLITCTPYGINSHRLLVRGIRTDYQKAVENPETYVRKETGSNWMGQYKKSLIISFSALGSGLLILYILRRRKANMTAGANTVSSAKIRSPGRSREKTDKTTAQNKPNISNKKGGKDTKLRIEFK
ncbi:MAG: class C sortase [Parabacteroides gordonii]|nr:class C sortase [Parabacteroides gordonii]